MDPSDTRSMYAVRAAPPSLRITTLRSTPQARSEGDGVLLQALREAGSTLRAQAHSLSCVSNELFNRTQQYAQSQKGGACVEVSGGRHPYSKVSRLRGPKRGCGIRRRVVV
eukprot:6192431-Pleurochrysis_carterae.AAC.2